MRAERCARVATLVTPQWTASSGPPRCFFASRVSTIVLLGISMLWVAVAWAQAPRLTQDSVEASPDAATPECCQQAGKPLFTSREKPLILTPNVGQAESDRGPLRRASDQFLLSSKRPVLELAEKPNYLIDNAPKRWLADVTGDEGHQTFSSLDLKYLAGRTPFIGPTILRLAQQADAHPRITRLLMTLDPQF